jgi:HlyD family secretion protein
MRRSWIILIIVVVAIGAVLWIGRIRSTIEVVVFQPTRGTIRAWIEEQATTELPHDVLIAMPIGGWLEPIALREGDAVTAGQVVATLDTADLSDRVLQAQQRIAVLETQLRRTADHRLEENALVEAEATVKAIEETVRAAEEQHKAARAVRDFAADELQRVRNLVETNAAADRELRSAEMEYRKSEAELQSDALELAALKTIAAVSYIGPKFIRDYIDRKKFEAEETQSQLAEARAALEIEQRNLKRATIDAPIDGVVLERHNTRRQFLPAGTPLLTIGNLDDLEVIAQVLTERATRIDVGDPVEVFGEAIPGAFVLGHVKRVYPAGFKKISSLGVEQQRVDVAIGLDQRPERLGVGFRVYVRIIHDEAEDVLTLPRTALLRTKDGGWQVLEVVGNETRFQPVTIGLMNDDHVEVADGLKPDSRVIAQPTSEFEAGMRVRTRLRE